MQTTIKRETVNGADVLSIGLDDGRNGNIIIGKRKAAMLLEILQNPQAAKQLRGQLAEFVGDDVVDGMLKRTAAEKRAAANALKHTYRNRFHRTEFVHHVPPREVNAIVERIGAGTASKADKLLAKKMRRALCDQRNCKCTQHPCGITENTKGE